MRKRLILLVILALVASVAGWAGLRWTTDWRYQQATNDAYVAGDIITIAPKVAGYIVELNATDHAVVDKGAVLLRIDDREYKARVKDAEAAVMARRAAIASIENRARWQKSQISAALADIESAEADLRHARQETSRYAGLKANEIVSRQRLDQLDADQRKAQAAFTRAEARVDSERAQLPIIQSDLALARAQLDQAEAQLALAQTDLANTVVTAPVGGVIGNRSAQVGQFARAGASLLAVVPQSPIWVEANFKETQLTDMVPGQPATVTVDAFPGRPIKGRVLSFSPASGAKFSLLPPENATGNFTKVVQRVPVRISLDPDHPLTARLRPGLSVDVTVDTRASQPGS